MTPPRARGIWPDLQIAMQVTVEKLSPVLLEVEIQIPADRVRSHREVDAETLCPGRGLPMDGIREALTARLGVPTAKIGR